MESNRIIAGVADIFVNFFRNKSTRKESYQAYKAFIYEEIYRTISKENFKTPELAFSAGNQLIGLKYGLEKIQQQYELSKRIKEK